MHTKIGPDWEPDRAELLAGLREFALLMRGAPIRNEHGLRGGSAFALWWFLRALKPTIVFEVGVWRGFSTWLIEQAAPTADIHCFDPLFFLQPWMSRWKVGRVYRSARARYWTDEFSCASISSIVAAHERPVVFFDDHQNKLPRLHQARAAGFREIIFDDNMAKAGTHVSLEDLRGEPDGRALLQREVEAYEIFPALWPAEFHAPGLDIVEEGLGFPVEPAFEVLHRDRNFYSSVTRVSLRADA
ncbi:MAG TPA: hypothetical protein VF552_06750 [Allosphingosinicella sp.]|jgi:hypothetical protein